MSGLHAENILDLGQFAVLGGIFWRLGRMGEMNIALEKRVEWLELQWSKWIEKLLEKGQ